MKTTLNKFLCTSALVASLASTAAAQRGGPDWNTTQADPQRTSWVRWDPFISAAKENKLEIKKLWSLKMAGTAGRPSDAIMISTYIGYNGFKALALVTGPNYLYTADYDLGVPYYDKHYSTAKPVACDVYPSAVGKLSSLTPIAPRKGNPTAPYRSSISKPHEGADLSVAMGGRLGGGPPRVAAPAMQLPPGIRFSVPIFMVTSDGMAHAITFDSGKEVFKPVALVPPGSAVSDLIVVDNVLYANTLPGCGSHPNTIYALDVSTPDMKPEGAWKATAGDILGPAAFNKSGTLFVATTKGLYALKPKTLEPITVAEAPLVSTPVIITGKTKEWAAATTADGSIVLMDASGAASAPVKSASGFKPTSLSTFDDASGAHYLLATDTTSTTGAVHAYKIADDGTLKEAWKSAELNAPGRPIIVDGIVFALATGANRTGLKPGVTPTKGTHATLYALDALTGKPLWDSGSDITSFVGTSNLTFNESQVYLTTYDNTLYAFGHPDPRQ